MSADSERLRAWADLTETSRDFIAGMQHSGVVVRRAADRIEALAARIEELEAERDRLREALREACLQQGLPADAPPERIAAHFRNNREYREGWESLTREARSRGEQR